MPQEAYDAFNRLARRFHQAVGQDGPATEVEAEQMAAEYMKVVLEHLSDETLATALDELRAGKVRMKNAEMTVKSWLETEEGQKQEREFKRFIANLYSRMSNHVAPAT
ncbi:MAG TPA: hypothetical protein IGS52_20275 [Oscillatoriaceae cyanobacterium M33_DOE_052]|uniref:Uncharacterized protein n=1 Tax=Planktothricoides sp. SpSt-374 TaxID=2282167 RepID=A0A7C3ZWK7_9CYAN|nr:hypothetical protein [Oscillatoriaceae cyanobacterium M33_DOE_052]